LSCAKLDPECDAYHCYRCVGENWEQNGSILSVVDCGGIRCNMSKIEREIQLKVKKEIEKMGLLNRSNNSGNSDCLCDTRNGEIPLCDVVVQCDGNTRGLNNSSNKDCNCTNELDTEVIAMALKLLLDKADTLEKGQEYILKKLLN
jgi:hypothetical protein